MLIRKSKLQEWKDKMEFDVTERVEKRMRKRHKRFIEKLMLIHAEELKEKNKIIKKYEEGLKKYKAKSFCMDDNIRDIDGFTDFVEQKLQEITTYGRRIVHKDEMNKIFLLKNEKKLGG